MAKMGLYCKAYPSERFHAFPEWATHAREPEPAQPHYYLQQDFTVTTGIFMDDHLVWDAVTPEWQGFCTDVLLFAVPEDRLPEPTAAPAGEEAVTG
jgi:hypothetical protein